MRLALRERGVNVVSLTPFMSLSDADRQFTELCDDLGRPRYIDNPDITQQQSAGDGQSVPKSKKSSTQAKSSLLTTVQNYFSRAS